MSTEAATYYFRKEFQFTGLPVTSVLQLNPIIDDGAVFYLNGLEVARTNMPSGTVIGGECARLLRMVEMLM